MDLVGVEFVGACWMPFVVKYAGPISIPYPPAVCPPDLNLEDSG